MEDFSGASGAKSVNFKIMSFFYNRGAKKKAVKLLRNMESYIPVSYTHLLFKGVLYHMSVPSGIDH